jgi:hypothetical protein
MDPERLLSVNVNQEGVLEGALPAERFLLNVYREFIIII